jgi:hypothetical protein
VKKQIALTTKDGLMYAVTLNASLTSGEVSIESCVKTAQLFNKFKPCLEKTLSVKAENGSKRYLVSLVKTEDGEFDAVLDDITTGATKPLWQVIAGKSKLAQAVYDEIWTINYEFNSIYSVVENDDQEKAVDKSRNNSLYRVASKLSDSIHKQNMKNGTVYTVQNFINACLTLAL